MHLQLKRQSIGLISLTGILTETSALNFALALRSLPTRGPMRALIVRISSGGGSLAAAQTIAESLESLRQELNMPSIALATDMATSSAFYVGQSADRFVASPASVLGNAGAVAYRISVHELLAKLGVGCTAICSGEAKDTLGPFSALSEKHAAVLQELVNDNAEQFMSYLRSRRTISAAALGMLGSGALFSGRCALQHQLVDELGGLFSAIRVAGEMTQSTSPRLTMVGAGSAIEASRWQGSIWGLLDMFSSPS